MRLDKRQQRADHKLRVATGLDVHDEGNYAGRARFVTDRRWSLTTKFQLVTRYLERFH